MTLPVIITRAEPGARETATRVAELGFHSILSPALSIQPIVPPPPLDLTGVTGLLFTSANGVRTFAARSDRRDIEAICVGRATRAAAEAAGWTVVKDADGNAADLAALVSEQRRVGDGRLLHVANEAAAGRLMETLRARGYDVGFAPLYRTVDARNLAPEALASLSNGPCCVLIHSAKGAAAFDRLAPADCKALMVCAVSKAAAGPLSERRVADLYIAERPNEDALLRALSFAASTL
ncbi:MAG: uroporphyrinogen-III synthase [Pseudomonadota bacterium]